MKGKVRESCYQYLKNPKIKETIFDFDIFTIGPESKVKNKTIQTKIDFIEIVETNSLEEIQLILNYDSILEKYKKIFFFIEESYYSPNSFRFPGEGFYFKENNISGTKLPECTLRKILQRIVYEMAFENKKIEIINIEYNHFSKYYVLLNRKNEVIFKTQNIREVYEFINKS